MLFFPAHPLTLLVAPFPVAAGWELVCQCHNGKRDHIPSHKKENPALPSAPRTNDISDAHKQAKREVSPAHKPFSIEAGCVCVCVTASMSLRQEGSSFHDANSIVARTGRPNERPIPSSNLILTQRDQDSSAEFSTWLMSRRPPAQVINLSFCIVPAPAK